MRNEGLAETAARGPYFDIRQDDRTSPPERPLRFFVDLCRKMVLLDRIELSTSSLPMTRSTTELQQQPVAPEPVFAGQARPMAGLPSPVKVRHLTIGQFRKIGRA